MKHIIRFSIMIQQLYLKRIAMNQSRMKTFRLRTIEESSDHPNGKKEGGVCLYFKKNLPIKRRKDLEITQETVICEISIRRKKVFFIAMYRSPNQSSEEFNAFYRRLQEIFDIIKDAKPHCVILTGDLNCHSKQFWSDDIDSAKGVALVELIESNNLAN